MEYFSDKVPKNSHNTPVYGNTEIFNFSHTFPLEKKFIKTLHLHNRVGPLRCLVHSQVRLLMLLTLMLCGGSRCSCASATRRCTARCSTRCATSTVIRTIPTSTRCSTLPTATSSSYPRTARSTPSRPRHVRRRHARRRVPASSAAAAVATTRRRGRPRSEAIAVDRSSSK